MPWLSRQVVQKLRIMLMPMRATSTARRSILIGKPLHRMVEGELMAAFALQCERTGHDIYAGDM